MRNPRTVGIERSPLLAYRCRGCGYGASRRTAPERCPMCGGAAWENEGWRPFAAAAAEQDADAPLLRETAARPTAPAVPQN